MGECAGIGDGPEQKKAVGVGSADEQASCVHSFHSGHTKDLDRFRVETISVMLPVLSSTLSRASSVPFVDPVADSERGSYAYDTLSSPPLFENTCVRPRVDHLVQ